MNITDDLLISELSERFAASRRAFGDLTLVNRKLLEMNEKLQQSESLKSNFLSNIRNEINNPLNAIMGLAGQLIIASEGNEEAIQLASLIGAEANHLDFQLRNIFIAAELEAGAVNPHSSKFHVATLLRDLIETFQYLAIKKNITLALVLPEDEAELVIGADFDKIQIMIYNLLANGIEFSHEDGVVTVTACISAEGNLQISVKDQGIGIAPEDHERIFDRFVQLETGTTRSHLGHGLGLSITKSLVELLEGRILLESAPGAGTTCTVTIPPALDQDDDDAFSEAGNMFFFDDMCEV